MTNDKDSKDPFYSTGSDTTKVKLAPPVEPVKPTRVGLRSDSMMASLVTTKKWWWVGGGLVLLVVIGSGLLLMLPGKKAATDQEDNGGFFSDLPLSLDAVRNTTVSGLSGRQCDDANRRPIAVMLAADPINRPVSGFADADLVFELPVLVSDVTRLLAAYQCGRPADIGSVRSARHDYLFLAEGIDAIVGHWGGSYHALNRIAVGEFQTINAITNPYGAYFRKNHLPAPYNGFTTYDNLWNALQKLGYRTETNFKGYEFKDSPDVVDRPAGGTLSIAWPGAFRVHYEYNPETNLYERYWAGTKQLDGGTDAEVAPSVVAIMRAPNTFAVGEGGYNDVGIEGEGALEVYQDGTVIHGTWRKNEMYKNDPIAFLDESGKPITFTRGQVWVMAVEPTIVVTWEAVQAVDTSVSAEQPVSAP